eukprot:73481-Pyramimonas_sp.AAC.1
MDAVDRRAVTLHNLKASGLAHIWWIFVVLSQFPLTLSVINDSQPWHRPHARQESPRHDAETPHETGSGYPRSISHDIRLADIISSLGLYKLSGLHDPTHGNWVGKKTRGNWTWGENYRVVREHGHQWCKLQRDNWSCVGEEYARILADVPTYDLSLTLAALPNGTRIFAEGNSFLAQHVAAIVCNTVGAQVYVAHDTSKNDLVVYLESSDVLLVSLNNDCKYNYNYTRTVEFVRQHLKPTVVLLGDLNLFGDAIPDCERRGSLHLPSHHFNRTRWMRTLGIYNVPADGNTTQRNRKIRTLFYRSVWGVPIVGWWQHRMGRGCEANFRDCFNNTNVQHQCSPGPLLRGAESVARKISSV